jgi:hypothetical protein
VRFLAAIMLASAMVGMLASPAGAGFKSQSVYYAGQSTIYSIEATSTYAVGLQTVYNHTSQNTTYAELFVGTVQCNGYG